MAEAKRSTGSVRWFNAQKGFGFISPDDGGEDLFVHQTSIRSQGFRTLLDGQEVEFSVDFDEEQRPKAVDVTTAAGSSRPSGGRGGDRGRGGRFSGRSGGGGGYGRNSGYGGGRGSGSGSGSGYGGGGPSGGGGSGVECYNCSRVGHLARDCYQRTGSGPARGGRTYGGVRGSSGGGGCYNCGEEGHFARDCPNDQN